MKQIYHPTCTFYHAAIGRWLILSPAGHRTHGGRWRVHRLLDSGRQTLLDHAGEAVELVLRVDLKDAQQLPLLSQTAPPPPPPPAQRGQGLRGPVRRPLGRPVHLSLETSKRNSQIRTSVEDV